VTRLLLLSGSTRTSSTNGAALEAIAGFDGVDSTSFAGLRELPAFNPDDDHEPLPPTVVSLRAAIDAADAIVICTPEYAGTLPGSFKNLLDWTVGGSEIGGKPVAWISVAAPGRGAGAIETLRIVLGYVDADVIEDACVSIPIGRGDLDASGHVESVEILADLRSAVDTVVSYVPATLEG
jgi:NAD(P)H-dependent FMN reductase